MENINNGVRVTRVERRYNKSIRSKIVRALPKIKVFIKEWLTGEVDNREFVILDIVLALIFAYAYYLGLR